MSGASPRWGANRNPGGDVRFEDAINSTKNPDELMALIASAPEGATTYIEGRQRRIGTPGHRITERSPGQMAYTTTASVDYAQTAYDRLAYFAYRPELYYDRAVESQADPPVHAWRPRWSSPSRTTCPPRPPR